MDLDPHEWCSWKRAERLDLFPWGPSEHRGFDCGFRCPRVAGRGFLWRHLDAKIGSIRLALDFAIGSRVRVARVLGSWWSRGADRCDGASLGVRRRVALWGDCGRVARRGQNAACGSGGLRPIGGRVAGRFLVVCFENVKQSAAARRIRRVRRALHIDGKDR